jgi:hypothetical protein
VKSKFKKDYEEKIIQFTAFTLGNAVNQIVLLLLTNHKTHNHRSYTPNLFQPEYRNAIPANQ